MKSFHNNSRSLMSKFSSKKRNNIAPEEERVSLMSNQDGRPMQSRDRRRKTPSSFSLPSKPSSKRGAKKRNNVAPQEERVSLIGNNGKPTPSPDERGSQLQDQRPPWTFSRLMRYLSLTAVSAMVTFIILRKESKVLHWEEYHYLLEPAGPREERCYTKDSRGTRGDTRCTCPDPAQPLPNSDSTWRKHHLEMVKDARQAPRDLDIVFLGDSMIERWNGTRNMGQQSIPGMRKVFAERFTVKGGGTFEGLALGSSGDTGPNLLWHLQHGLLDAVNPKIWLIFIGTNDLFESKCTDRFVVANILNVLKAIYVQKPDAQFIIHGILPRKDHAESKSQFMGADWKRAQAINWQVRKFCEHSSQLYYIQAGPLFTEETSVRGRRQIDEKLMTDGIHPTVQGLEIWGDYLVKQVKGILDDVEKAKQDALEETEEA